MSLTNPIQVNAGAESSIEQPISTSSTTTKRKQADDQIDQDDQDDDDDDDDDEEVTHINTTFTFISPTSIDYHAIKALLSQLFHTHAQSGKIQISPLADGVLSRAGVDVEAEAAATKIDDGDTEMEIKPSVGTVVKVEGSKGDAEGDPFALISAVELLSTSPDPSSPLLLSYFLSVLPTTSPLHSIFSSSNPSTTLLLHSRLSNLPFQISIPCYRLILSEQTTILEEAGKPLPKWAMFFSRCFKASANHWENEMDEDDEDEDKPRGLKKRKGGKNGGKTKKVGHEKKVEKVDSEALGYFNPEDEIFAKFATHLQTYSFPPPTSADPSLFQAPLLGLVALVPWEKVSDMVDAIEVEVEKMGHRLDGDDMGMD